MEEMIAYQKRFLEEYNSYMPNPITKEEYEQLLRFTLPSLKRWKYLKKFIKDTFIPTFSL